MIDMPCFDWLFLLTFHPNLHCLLTWSSPACFLLLCPPRFQRDCMCLQGSVISSSPVGVVCAENGCNCWCTISAKPLNWTCDCFISHLLCSSISSIFYLAPVGEVYSASYQTAPIVAMKVRRPRNNAIGHLIFIVCSLGNFPVCSVNLRRHTDLVKSRLLPSRMLLSSWVRCDVVLWNAHGF